MNIFVVSTSPMISAWVLDDKRLNKMFLETTQLLCTTIKINSRWSNLLSQKELESLYRVTHINHPCSVWARKEPQNTWWLFQYWRCLHNEYRFRFAKEHLCFTKFSKLFDDLWGVEASSYVKPDTFVDCSGISSDSHVFGNYMKCLSKKWNKDIVKPKWTKRDHPSWYRSSRHDAA